MPTMYEERGVRTSFIQHLPASRRKFRAYLPIYPLAARSLDLSDYDVVIASSSAFIHGVSVGPKTLLVCYCHSPFRYIWSHYDVLVADRVGAARGALLALRSLMRKWDVHAVERVDHFIAPSNHISERILTTYGRASKVISPPVDLSVFSISSTPLNYFLVVSPLVRWKRVDVAIEAFSKLGLALKIVGDGPERARLQAMAGKNVEFLGPLNHRQVDELTAVYSQCRGLILPSAEDFGLTALEAMACGRPVIAYGAGGALETVVDGITGCFFGTQSPGSLAAALQSQQKREWDAVRIRAHAATFSVAGFKARMLSCIEDWITDRAAGNSEVHATVENVGGPPMLPATPSSDPQFAEPRYATRLIFGR